MKPNLFSGLMSKSISKKGKTIISLLMVMLIIIPSFVLPSAALAIPVAPNTLTAAITAGTRNIVLNWNAPSAGVELGFYVYRDTVNTFNSLNLLKIAVGPSAAPVAPAVNWTGTYTEIAPVAGGTFFYRVTAWDVTGESATSNTVTLAAPSAAPTGLTAALTAGTRNIVLTWNGNAFGSELGYYIYRDTVTTFNSANLKVSQKVGPSPAPVAPATLWADTFTDTPTVAGGTYYYRVAAYDLKGPSTFSNTVALTVAAAAPSGMTATAPAGTGTVILNWVSNSGGAEMGFYIEGDTANTFNTANLMQSAVGPRITTYTDVPALSGTWFYRVRAYDLSGQTANSNVVNVVVGAILSVPTTPTDFAAAVAANSDVTLTWTDNAIDETAYQVQRATNATFTNGLTTYNLAAGATSYLNTTTNGNTTYYYRVSASNNNGRSGYATLQTRTAVPTAPTIGTATASSPTQVVVTWTPPTIPNQTTFRVDRATNTGFTANLVTVNNVAATLTSYTDSTVAAATIYYYRVYAINGRGTSPASGNATVTTPAVPTVPAAPTGLTATAISGTQVDLAWTNPADTLTGLRVERATNAGFTTGLTPFTVAVTATTYSDTTVSPVTAYWYRVIATNAVGDSAPSVFATLTTPDVAPAAPTGLTATVVTPNVRLNWTDVATNESNYIIQKATDAAFTAGLTNITIAAGSITYLDLAAAPATTYYYRVYATNAIGNSATTNVASATTVAIGAPLAPSGLGAVAAGPTSVNLSWTNNDTNQSGVRLERATNAAFSTGLVQYNLTAAAAAYADTVLPNTTYYYRVFATNAAGDSLPSNTASVGAPNAIPLAPTMLVATLVTNSQINLSWIDNSNNEDGFKIYTAFDSAFTQGLVEITLPANANTFSDTTVYAGDTFYYRVTAYNSLGASSASNVVSVTIVLNVPGAPAAATGLGALVGANNQVDLTWTDNATNESGYMIERALDVLFTQEVVTFNAPADSTSYSDTTALPQTTYYYRVAAFNSLGSAIESIPVGVTTASLTLAAPTSLRGNVGAPGQVSLSWLDNALNETGYVVARAEDAAFTIRLVSFTTAANSTSYIDTTAVNGAMYYYLVAASNAAGNSAPSNTIMVVAGTPPNPTTLSGTAMGPDSINLTWVDVAPNELSYQVQRSSNNTFTLGVVSFTLPANSTSYTDTGLMKLTTYYYRVFASNAAGNSAFSNMATITTFNDVPLQLVNLTAGATAANRVTLGWTNLNAAGIVTSIRIERGLDMAFAGTVTVFTSGAATISYTDTTAVANTTYYYRVFAVNASGLSSVSNTASATTPATTPGAIPAAPTGLTATLINSGQINLAWTHNGTNVAGFNIETTSDPAFLIGVVTIPVVSTARTYSDFTVYPGATFYYRVRAYNVLGTSNPSNTVNVVVPAATVGAPAAPTGLTAAVVSTTELNLTWVDGSTNEAGFILYRAQDIAFTTGVTTFIIGPNTAAFLDDTVSSTVLYYYRICAFNAIGISAMSNIVSASTTGTVIPAAPTGLIASAVSATQINLAWVDNANNETGYRVERATDAAFTANLTTFPLAAGIISFNNTGLTQLTAYYYRVFAFNATGDSAVSNTSSAATLSASAPATPGSFTALISSATQINLGWTILDTTASSIRIERATSADFLTNLTTINLPFAGGTYPLGGQMYSDTTVAVNNVYYYRIYATNTSGASAPSVTVIINMNTPAAPSGFTATTVNATRIDLAWTDNSSTEDGFQIERAVNDTFSAGRQVLYAQANAVSISDTGLIPGVPYYYRIQAFSTVLGSSAYVTATGTTASPPPTAPINLSALPVSGSRIDLVWTNTSASYTEIWMERALDTNFTVGRAVVAALPPTATSFSDTYAMTPNTTYYYQVYAGRGAAWSRSNIGTVTTPDVSPAASTNLSAVAVSATQIDLSWTNNHTNAASMRIERSTNAAFTAWLTYFNVAPTATTYSDTSVAANTRYYYRVYAINAVGRSPASIAATVVTADVAPLAPTITSIQAISDQRVYITWTPNSANITGYNIERAPDAAGVPGVWAPLTSTAATITSFNDTSVASSTIYYYRVFANNALGTSPASNIVTITTPVPPAPGTPFAPSNLAAGAISTTEVNLDWTDNATNETGFNIERAPDAAGVPGAFAQIATVGADVTTYSDNTLAAGTTYYYRVFATNANGTSPASNVASVTTASNPAWPTAPINVTVAYQAGPPAGVLVSWTNTATNATSIRVTRAENSTFTLNVVNWTLQNTATSYLDTSIVAGKAYYYRVTALGSNSPPGVSGAIIIPPAPPAAPTGLSASPISTTQVNLAWTDNATDELAYRVERSLDNFTSIQTTFNLAADATSYNDTSVAASTTYYYRVFANNAAGDSTASNIANATTPANPAAPSAPSGLVASAVTTTRIDLAWTDNSGDETGFTVERAGDAAFTAPTSIGLGANISSYSDTGLTPGTTYYYRVYATNAVGNSPNSNTSSAATPDVPPAAPTGLATSVISATQVNLTWTDNANNETGFSIERATNSAFSAGLATFTAAAGATSYNDTTAVASTAYYYRVFAVNASGSSPASNTATATTPGTLAAAPSNVVATAAGATQVDVTWNDNSINETNFRVERATNSAFSAGLVAFPLVAADGTTYNDATTVASTTYYYRVFAVNASGDSAASNMATVTTPTDLPTAPGTLNATVISGTRVDLAWTPDATNQTAFRIERAANNTFTTALTSFNVTNPAATSYSDTSVAPANTYYYRIIATNAAGDSSPSNTAAVTTTDTVPNAPSGLAATAAGTSQIDLTWTDNSQNETGFTLERATNAGFTTALTTFTVGANTTSYSDNTTAPATTYYYRVSAYNAAGTSAPATSANATTSAGTLAAPSGLTAAAIDAARVDLTWVNNATTQTGFRVERATDAAFTLNLTLFNIADPAALTYSDVSVAGATVYYYRVFAFDGMGSSSPASNTATATTPAAGAPIGPSGLTATAANGNKVDLVWVNNAVDQTGFRVERATDAAFTLALTPFVIADLAALTYSDITAMPLTTYYYRVFATNAAGDSLVSNTATATTPDVVPAAPTVLTAVAASGTQVDLAWTNNATNQTGFRVERATDAAFTVGLTPFVIANAAAVTYSDTTAAPLTAYYYRVYATNLIGSSLVSNTAGPVTTPDVVPAAPTLLTATAVGPNQVNLAWTNNATNQTGFRVERATDNLFTVGLTPFVIANAAALTYSDTTAAAATIYYYRVYATNAIGNSLVSNTATVTTPSGVPAAPTLLTGVATSATHVDLAWTNNATDQTGFRVERATDNLFTVGLTPFVIASATTFTYSDTTAAAATTYYYRVYATNAIGNSLVSNTATVLTPATGVPIAPNNLTAVKVNDYRIDLAWMDNSSDETGFHIETATNAAFTGSITITVGANVTSYIDGSVAPVGDTYYYRVTAYNAAGDSLVSNVVSVLIAVPAAGSPAAPSSLNGTAVGTGQVNLDWADNSNNEVGFIIERATDSSFISGFTSIITAANVIAYSDTGVSASTTYYYRVKAFNAIDSSVPSNVVTVVIGGAGTGTGGTGGTTGTGGGGGGGAVGVTFFTEFVQADGTVVSNVEARSTDGRAQMVIPAGTKFTTSQGYNGSSVSMVPMAPEERPAPPAEANVIGLVYQLGPQGATFSQPIQLTFVYTGYQIPAGVAEKDLIIAYWDSATGKWVPLQNCVVDTVAKKITGTVTHFTPFTILGYPPAPAKFTASNLTVSPASVKTGETVTVTATVTNSGGTPGVYSVILRVNGTQEAKKDVTLGAGASQAVTFTLSKSSAGSYNLDVNGQTGSFTVTAPTPTTTTTTPAPTQTPTTTAPTQTPTPTQTTLTTIPVTTTIPTSSPYPTPTPSAGFNWWIIGAIVGGGIAVILIVAAIRRKDA